MAKIPYVNATRVRHLALACGVTQKHFCDAFGKNPTYLKTVFDGRCRIDDYELEYIAKKLDTTVEYLTDKTDDPKRPGVEYAEPKRDETEDAIASLVKRLSREQKKMILAQLRGLLSYKE